MKFWIKLLHKQIIKKILVIILLLCSHSSFINGQTKPGQVDLFVGVDFNYRDIHMNGRVYDFLVNLTPSVKWYMGKGWQSSAQVLVPIINQYGDRYKKVRMNMAVLSKEMILDTRWFLKASGGLFGSERYGIDLKSMYMANNWLALEVQAGWTGFCSMAVDWEASMPKRWTALGGLNLYLNSCNTQFRVRAGRFLYGDYGATADVMRHFKHCTVGVYAQHSNKGGNDGGFKIVMILPPYKRKSRQINFRPASNFRHVYSIESKMYANRMYNTDTEENEREGWFDRNSFRWGSNCMKPDFQIMEDKK